LNIENDSFAFSVLVDYDLNQYHKFIFKGYDRQTATVDINVLSHRFTFNLPSNEIYLRATTIQGGGNTPAGFRLQTIL
jgi:hypothetical protein